MTLNSLLCADVPLRNCSINQHERFAEQKLRCFVSAVVWAESLQFLT